ncbi:MULTISPECIES: SsrA-binding protein SmpB [unclassified Saccharopolyspora]|uniref:SsrA-binding protein SmpB n=2 Tax=Saccharopolyspora TaxID=1835 RepID=UPI001CD6763B|nr:MULTISPECIES: SsrA-binding protein SmpB [unclassified Saccharopolyspora]MCA1228413.1 SsrA-binding protein SmpB [Saccharopolyspora sp. 6M]MCA1281887.1 SsrA-binding protein SmpB [Saccharopolyspora sp. 7B]
MVQHGDRSVIARNRRARHHFTILDTYEAGLVLVGTEVKSLRLGRASLAEAFATVDDGEVWLRNLHIAEYWHGSWTNHTPRRTRKMLLHAKEIRTLTGKSKEAGHALVPLSMYFSDGWVKVELALARGKKNWDKRRDIAARDAEREMARGIGWRLKGHPGRDGKGRRRPPDDPVLRYSP